MGIKKKPVEFISTTNPKFKYFEGSTGILKYIKGFSANFELIDGFLYTSDVQEIIEEDGVIELQTLNSVYKFKEI